MNIIPCAFQTRHHLKASKVQLEWGVIPKGKQDYRPLMHLYGDHIRWASPDIENKYQVFKPLVAKGNCSLVINPTDMEDSGTYQVKLIITGKEFKPPSSIKIKVVNQHKAESRAAVPKATNTVPPSTTTKETKATAADDFISDTILPVLKGHEKAFGVVVIATTIVLALWSVIGLVICIKYRQMKNKGKAGDVENPPQQATKEGKYEEKESSSSESEESTSYN
eukprot:XP_017950280.1 PREDICTED: uncharacterized protein LOC108647850 [Xenopus tropicalis]